MTKQQEIDYAQKQLVTSLSQHCTQKIPVSLGFQGGYINCTINWSPTFGLWFHSRKLENRYWNAFGLSEVAPKYNSMLPIIVEINPPVEGLNRRVQGAFVLSEKDELLLVHRGKIGGGRPGIGRKLFFDNYQGETRKIDERNFAIIGEITSSGFVRKVKSFVEEVGDIKAIVERTSNVNTEANILTFIVNILRDLNIEYEPYKLFISNSKKWVVDLFFSLEGINYFIEIKLGKYVHPNYVEELIFLKELFGKEKDVFYLIMSGDSRFYPRGRNLFEKSGWELIKLHDRNNSTLVFTYDEINNQVINNIKLHNKSYKRTFNLAKSDIPELDYPEPDPELEDPELDPEPVYDPEYPEPITVIPSIEEKGVLMKIHGSIGLPSSFRIAEKFHYIPRISREILDLIPNLHNIDYANILKRFYKEYEKITNYDEENQLIIKYLQQLWSGKYGKEDSGKSFELHEKFETILKYIEGYRDHFVHQFQVFLIGAIIIDKNYSDFIAIYRNTFQNMKNDSLDFSWLLCSTFHDFCYPIQLYDQFNSKLINEFLNIHHKIIEINYEKILLEGDNLKYIDQLVSLYESILNRESNWEFNQECNINNFMRSLFIENLIKGNHAILSSITLIDKILVERRVQDNFDEYVKGRLSTDVMPSSLAICMHDKNIFSVLPDTIELHHNLLSFLLIYCDAAQECGRLDNEENVEIYKFEISDNIIHIGLMYNEEKYFIYKTNELENVFNHIISDNFIFKLEIKYGKTTVIKQSNTT